MSGLRSVNLSSNEYNDDDDDDDDDDNRRRLRSILPPNTPSICLFDSLPSGECLPQTVGAMFCR